MDDAEFDPSSVRYHAHPGAVVVQPPIGAERYLHTTSRATRGPRPKIRLGVSLGADRPMGKFRTFVVFVLAAADAAHGLRVRAIAAGAVGGILGGIHIGQQFAYTALESLGALAVGVQQRVAVSLRPFAGGPEYQASDGVQLVGDGTESQPSGLEGDGAAAGGNVEDDGVWRTGQVLVEPVQLVAV